MKNTEILKQQAAIHALSYIEDNTIIGVGTGSTVNYFIEALGQQKHRITGAVASSIATEIKLRELGIPIIELNAAHELPIYIDGADEANHFLQLIKGGGGALCREKIIATAAKKFICIIDETKYIDILGEKFPLPIEVLPLARSFVARELVKLGGRPVWRENFLTDNGNSILDIHQFSIYEPIKLEKEISQIPGVICCGIFALRPADELVMATQKGLRILHAE